MKPLCVEHDFIDKYSDKDSHIHRVDARVPLSWSYPRALIVVPFAGTLALVKALTVPGTVVASWWIFEVTVHGLIIAAQLLFRAYISVFAIVLLTSTTFFSTLLSALQRLRIPSIITSAFLSRIAAYLCLSMKPNASNAPKLRGASTPRPMVSGYGRRQGRSGWFSFGRTSEVSERIALW